MPQGAPRAGPGELLRAAREAARTSREELASRLNLRVDVIAALEEGRTDGLPEPAYIRGYLRASARALDIEAGPLLAAFDDQAREVPKVERPSPPRKAGEHRVNPYPFGVLLLLVVIGLGVYALYSSRPAPDPMAALPDPVETPAPAAVAEREPPRAEPLPEVPPAHVLPRVTPPTAPADESPEDIEPLVPAPPVTATEPPPTPAAPATTRPQTPAVTAPASPPTAAAPAPGRVMLSLRFNEDSWVDIRDADGDRLLVGLMRAGTERRLEGRAPMRVLLGNAPGVRLDRNGLAYDLRPHVQADNTARFTLSAP